MSGPLLKTKLYFPPARKPLVRRSRLVDRLVTGLRGPLTFISAPAGSGKTTLLSEWRAGEGKDYPAAWCSLDEADNDPRRFLFYLAAAFETACPGITSGSLSLFQSPQVPPVETMLIALVNDLSAFPDQLALVLDDYHQITAAPIHDLVTFLLDHLPPNIHLVILTRSDPSLPLSRLRVRSQLVEIRAEDLRFTPDEAAAFFHQVMQLDLSAEDISILETRTEGWIAGLQLAGLALQRETAGQEHLSFDDLVQSFQGSHHYVVEYLTEEVLNRQPDEVKVFLLQTSILEWMTGPLCDAVMRGISAGQRIDGQAMLERLDRANLFVIPLDPERRLFRYHRLFIDLLRQRLKQTCSKEIFDALHLRASAWLEQNGQPAEALAHLFEIHANERTAALLEKHGLSLLFRGELTLLRGWLQRLPEGLVHARPILCLINAWIIYMASLPTYQVLAEQWLDYADQAIDGLAPEEKSHFRSPGSLFQSNSAALRAYLAFDGRNDPRSAMEHASRALAGLPEGNEAIRCALVFLTAQAAQALGDQEAAWRALEETRRLGEACGSTFLMYAAVYLQAVLLRERGQLRVTANLCRKALHAPDGRLSHPLRIAPGAGPLAIVLGSILLEWNDLEEAKKFLLFGQQMGDRTEAKAYQFESFAWLVRLRLAQREVEQALQVLDQAMQVFPFGYFMALRAQVWISQSEADGSKLQEAAKWAAARGVTLERSEILESIHPLLHRDVERLTLARLLIAQRRAAVDRLPDLAPLIRFLDVEITRLEASGWLTQEIEYLLLQALAWDAQGDLHNALKTLERVLGLAEPEGYTRVFLDEGLAAARLLEEAARRGLAPRFVSNLLAAFGRIQNAAQTAGALPVAPPAASIARPIGLLTPRETELLRLIGAGKTNKEIAAALVISVETVKRHTVNIFRKLDVQNRTEAAARARVLGLL